MFSTEYDKNIETLFKTFDSNGGGYGIGYY